MNGAGPLFILSPARSGSTLLRIVLDTHPQIYSPPELNLGRLARDLASSIAWLEGTHDRPAAENGPVVERVRAILGDLLDSYARRRGKTLWCEKSPDNAFHAELLAAVFPEARFLCLYRHALDMVHSCIEINRYGFPPGFQDYLRQHPGDHVQAILQYWVDVATATTELERRLPGRTFRLRYEDLVAAPQAILAPLFGFLGLDWDPALLGAVFTSEHDRGPGDPYVYYTDRIRQESVGTGRNLPLDTLSAGLRDRLQALLAELGYQERPEKPAKAAQAAAPAAAPGAGAEPGFAAAQLFEQLLPARAAASPPPPAPLACDVFVHGPGGGAWSLAWDEGGLRVTPSAAGLPSRIELEAQDLLAIVSGQANPLQIAQEGRLRVEGEQSDTALRGLLQLVLAS